MLKAYLLAPIEDPQVRSQVQRGPGRRPVLELISWGGTHATGARCQLHQGLAACAVRRKRARAQSAALWTRNSELDFGSVFHRWVRDHSDRLGLGKAPANQRLMAQDFPSSPRPPGAYYCTPAGTTRRAWRPSVNATDELHFGKARRCWRPSVETDDDETVRRKMAVTATYLDIWLMRRAVNYIRVGYSSVSYAMWLLCRDIPAQAAGRVGIYPAAEAGRG